MCVATHKTTCILPWNVVGGPTAQKLSKQILNILGSGSCAGMQQQYIFISILPYLIFVVFLHEQNFWRIKFTPKKRVNYDKIHRKLPIFCVKSVKIYTGQKKCTREFSWLSWQIWGMSRGRLPWICAIFRVLYECPFPLFKARQRIISCLRNMRRIWSVESHTLFLSGFLKRCSLEAASSPWRILISVEGAKNCPDGAPRENIGIKQAGARGGRIIASPPWREVHVQGVLSHNSAILLLWSAWLPWFTFTFYFSMWWSSPSRKWCNPVCIQSRLK